MDHISQTEEWTKLGLTLEAVQVHDSWTIQVKRINGKGSIRFVARTRVERGQMDPWDAFISLCETFANLPRNIDDSTYEVWLETHGLPNTSAYRSRFNELVRQRDATVAAFGFDAIAAVACLRPKASQKKVLPVSSSRVGPANLNPAPGVPVQTP